MFNFIICDNNKKYVDKTKQIINNIMNDTNYTYEIKVFYEYSKDLEMIINNDFIKNKIYILEYELPKKTGLDIARNIREIDYDSLIIFLSIHESYELFHAMLRLLVFDFINKFNFDSLSGSIKDAVKIIEKKFLTDKTIEFKSNHILIKIKLDDILYVMTSVENRGVNIHTKNNEYHINKTLTSISNELDNRFLKTHRSCYINLDHVTKLDSKYRCITFDNNDTLNLVSVRQLKNLKKYF